MTWENLGKKGKECGGKKDQIITWDGPITTFRWDDSADVDFKFLSVREIDSLIDLRKVCSMFTLFDLFASSKINLIFTIRTCVMRIITLKKFQKTL